LRGEVNYYLSPFQDEDHETRGEEYLDIKMFGNFECDVTCHSCILNDKMFYFAFSMAV